MLTLCMPTPAVEATLAPRRLLLSELEGGASTAPAALHAVLATESFAVIVLDDPLLGGTLHSSLCAIGSRLERFHGCSPRFHECSGSTVSSWSRRVFMHYERGRGDAPFAEQAKWPQKLAEAATAAAAVDPVLCRVARAVVAAV